MSSRKSPKCAAQELIRSVFGLFWTIPRKFRFAHGNPIGHHSTAIFLIQKSENDLGNQSTSSFVRFLWTCQTGPRLPSISGLLTKTVTLLFQTRFSATSVFQLNSNSRQLINYPPGPTKPTQISINIKSSEASTLPQRTLLDILDMTTTSTNPSLTRIDSKRSNRVRSFHSPANLVMFSSPPRVCRSLFVHIY